MAMKPRNNMTMDKSTEDIKSSFHNRLKVYQANKKSRLDRSPLRDLTRRASKLLNVTTCKAANRKSKNETSDVDQEDQEWTQIPVAAALNPAPSLAFPPPPSAISPHKRRYPSPPINCYIKSFPNWEKPELEPRSKSNDRGGGDGNRSKLQGGIGNIRKSAIRDVLRKFKCEENTRVGTTYFEKRLNDESNNGVNLHTYPIFSKRGVRDDGEKNDRSHIHPSSHEKEKMDHQNGDGEDDNKHSSYNSSAVSMTLLRVELVGLKSKVCDMEAQLNMEKKTLEKERRRHERAETHLKKELEHMKTQLEQMKNLSHEEKLNLDSQVKNMETGAKQERLKHKETVSQLLEELGTLQKNQYQVARSKQELQKKYQDMFHEMELQKEKLREARRLQGKNDANASQFRTCEKTWQNKEKSLLNEINSIKDELIAKNNECDKLSEVFKEKESTLIKELEKEKQINSMTQNELNKFQNMAIELKEEKSKTVEMQNEYRVMKQKHTELVHSLRKKIGNLEDENKRSKECVEKYRKKKRIIEHEKSEEIKKLKEELKHAEFRVQVLKTEVREASPQKSVEKRLRKSIDGLQDELHKSRQETEEVQTRLEERFSRLECNKTIWEHDTSKSQMSGQSTECKDDLRAEIDRLTKQLNDARSRSRRIVVKSEAELAKVRDAEEAVKECAKNYEEEVKLWKDQFCHIERKCNEETRLRKDIEAMLQEKCKHQAQEESSLEKTLLSPTTSEKCNIEEDVISLTLVVTKLLSYAREIKESLTQNCEIEKASVDALIDDLDKLKIDASKLEVKVKKYSTKATLTLQNTIDSYENRIKESSAKYQKINNELQQSLLKKDQYAKQQKQAELNLLAKYTGLKKRCAQLQQDYDSCKMQAEEQEQKHDEVESWFLREFLELEAKLPKRENNLVQQRLRKIINNSPRKGILKKMRMKLQQAPSMEEVEVRLRDDDESVTSIFSQGDVSTLRAEIKCLKDLLKEMQLEATELKLERDRERKLRELSTKEKNGSQTCLLSKEPMQKEPSPSCKVQKELTFVAKDDDIK